MPSQRNGSTRAYRKARAQVLAASTVCHICGADGADATDHVIPKARGGTDHPSNLKPAHHDVPPFCNRLKGDKDHAPIVKRSGALN